MKMHDSRRDVVDDASVGTRIEIGRDGQVQHRWNRSSQVVSTQSAITCESLVDDRSNFEGQVKRTWRNVTDRRVEDDLRIDDNSSRSAVKDMNAEVLPKRVSNNPRYEELEGNTAKSCMKKAPAMLHGRDLGAEVCDLDAVDRGVYLKKSPSANTLRRRKARQKAKNTFQAGDAHELEAALSQDEEPDRDEIVHAISVGRRLHRSRTDDQGDSLSERESSGDEILQQAGLHRNSHSSTPEIMFLGIKDPESASSETQASVSTDLDDELMEARDVGKPDEDHSQSVCSEDLALEADQMLYALEIAERRLTEFKVDTKLLLTKRDLLDHICRHIRVLHDCGQEGFDQWPREQENDVRRRLEDLLAECRSLDDERLQLELKRWLIGGPRPTPSVVDLGPVQHPSDIMESGVVSCH
jgi:hypothetical protein